MLWGIDALANKKGLKKIKLTCWLVCTCSGGKDPPCVVSGALEFSYGFASVAKALMAR